MVVVADDDVELNRLMTRLLEQQGISTLSALDGEQAYRLIRSHPVDLLVLDLRMPHIGGAELLVLLSAEGSRLPVIVVASSVEADVERLRRFPNVRRVLAKPFPPEQLIQVVRANLIADA